MSSTLDEHHEYLSSDIRLNTFRKAIAERVRPGNVVVDLGCGFGILGLMCLDAGAAEVWGIDETGAIEIAREAARRSGHGDRYHCIAGSTFRTELPVLADVLICDHVGYLGFDYGIIPMIADARRRMLKPGGAIIPQSLDIHLAAAEGARLRQLNTRWNLPPLPPVYEWLSEYQTNARHAVSFTPSELASAPAAAGSVDLGKFDSDLVRLEAVVTADRSGDLDGLAGWFNSALTGNVTMTNSPLADRRIERPQAFLPFSAPLPVEPGDRLTLTVTARTDPLLMTWSAHNQRTGERRRQSTWRSQILTPQDRLDRSAKPARAGPLAAARREVLQLADGTRTEQQVEDLIVGAFPDLLPSEDELRKFVRAELFRNAR